jgi:hypothetical protein
MTSSRDMPSWGDLNERQQEYLKSVFEVDQALEANVKLAGARGRWNSTPASEWRWMPYNASSTALLRRIQDAGYRDEGTGSTFAALERRGLVLCKYEPGSIGAPILFVQITKVGRKLVREGLGLKAPRALPTGTLREWHWKALVCAYQAGSAGVREWPKGIGQGTLLRLEDYRIKGQDRPLIETARVPCEPYLRRRWPGDDGVMSTERSVTRITPFGEQFYRDNWQQYRELYPEVNAPAPGGEEELS